MKFHKCLSCKQYMKRFKRKYRRHYSFWCNRCQFWASAWYYTKKIDNLFLLDCTKGMFTEIRPLNFINGIGLVQGKPIFACPGELPINITAEKIKLLLTFS